jgi:hypothetical protein
MKRGIVYLFLFVLVRLAYCWHIVGGEIEFETVEVGLYKITLIQYRDAAQTENQFYENSLAVALFSNKTNERIETFTLALDTITDVPYSNQECSIAKLQTKKVVYFGVFELDPMSFAEEEGYYLSYERCCRNLSIVNIVNPSGTGMKYVLEIPPLWKDGAPFINSTPTLLRPLSDYACMGQFYYLEFTGEDPDGDSLVYRMVTPLNSSAQVALPTIKPKPYLPVSWANGYSLENIVPGLKPLKISREGLLTVNPDQEGLYVFSVMVEEWREGEKIGEVQRDFQMLVIDNCEPPDPPRVTVSIPERPGFDAQKDTLSFTLSEDKCFEFVVTNLNEGDTISFRAKGVNFDGYLDDVFQFNDERITPGQDSLIVEACMPGCPPVSNGLFLIDLIAADDACPLPQLDTARLMVYVEPPPNIFPEINSPSAKNYVLNQGDSIRLRIDGLDQDLDSVELTLQINGQVDPSSFGFDLEILKSEAGNTEAFLVWRTDCENYDFSELQYFEIGIHAEDKDACMLESPTLEWFTMQVNLPPNTIPVVQPQISDSVAITLGELLEFDVMATDADQDTLDLNLILNGFSAQELGIAFEGVIGKGEVESPFQWDTSCGNLDIVESTTFELRFNSEDRDKCEVANSDEKVIKVYVIIPENTQPEFEFYADTAVRINELFEMDISAFDHDFGDSVTIEFFNPSRLPRSEVIEFKKETGVGSVTSTFRWLPDCSLFDFGENTAEIEIPFIAFDNNCIRSKFDTMAIKFTVVQEIEQFNNFLPPNVFTPNGDGINDVYSLTNLTNASYNLPQDVCDNIFEYFSVVDRNGVQVFYSENREFQWSGLNVETGVYYYFIKFSNSEYKGYIQLLR